MAEEEGSVPRYKVLKELEALRAENKALRDDLKQKEIVLERYEGELRRYRSQPFQEEDFTGMRRYSKELVDLLKTRGQADSYKILEILGIDPRESELVKAISKQLEELEGYGMVKAEGRAWKWIA